MPVSFRRTPPSDAALVPPSLAGRARGLGRVTTFPEGGVLIDYLRPSAPASFYDRLFSPHRPIREPELYAQAKARPANPEAVEPAWQRLVDQLRDRLPEDATILELGGGVHQRRCGFLYRHFPNYVPLDISRSSIEQYVRTFQRTGIVSDAAELPFRDASVDAVVTRTFLEHPTRPDRVVAEIDRVLRPGGLVLHDDAWFCRWWSRFGIVGLKRFRSMNLRERGIYLAARLTEFPLFRMPPIVLGRCWREWFRRPDAAAPLRFRRLQPNYELYLACDEDAAASIDPLDVIRFYEARGYRTVEPLSRLGRLFYRNRYVLLEKGR
jgi:ubiquinone/menaquinone biosynthesis C-methylase UbiE